MAEPVVIYGKSGTGKSTSLENFADDEILYGNITGKRLPFRKQFKYNMVTDDVDKIKRTLSKCPDFIKVIVLDSINDTGRHVFFEDHAAH